MSAREALHSSMSVEWYTTPDIVERARRLLGRIWLDPASNALANEIVGADRFYTENDDGLAQPWDAPWFANIPYGDGKTKEWISKATGSEYPGVLLVNAVPDRSWFRPLWRYPICFPDRRIQFLESVGQRVDRIARQLAKKHGGDFEDYLGKVPDYKGETYAAGKLVVGPQPTHGNAIVMIGDGCFNEQAIQEYFGDLGHIAWPRR